MWPLDSTVSTMNLSLNPSIIASMVMNIMTLMVTPAIQTSVWRLCDRRYLIAMYQRIALLPEAARTYAVATLFYRKPLKESPVTFGAFSPAATIGSIEWVRTDWPGSKSRIGLMTTVSPLFTPDVTSVRSMLLSPMTI